LEAIELERGGGGGSGPRRIPYEPALDGLRGAAVLVVVLYHLNVAGHDIPFSAGGYLGVDAFFVLSGFLITSLLLVEWRDTGRINLKDFWSRRARRLLPALFLVVGVMVIYAAFFAQPTELYPIRDDGIATLFYFTNWHFIVNDISYFDQFLVPSPFQHMWSLAIEEQWYLFWPLALIAMLKVRKSLNAVLWFTGVLCVASVVWMAVSYDADNPSRVYFGTDTRAQSLLVGAFLACALLKGINVRDWTARHIVPAVGAVGLAVLVMCWGLAPDDAAWIYTGGFLLLSVSLAAVILAAGQPEGNVVRSTLSWEPLRRLGLISYGVYLWHWPIFVILRPQLIEDEIGVRPTGFVLLVLRVGVTLAVATASYLLVERPIRYGALRDRFRFSPVLIPLTAVGLLVLMFASTRGAVSPFDLVAAESPDARAIPTLEQLEEDLDPETRPAPDAEAAPPSAIKALIVGDSVANSMAEGFGRQLQKEEQVLAWNQTVLFCELADGPRQDKGEEIERSSTCEDWEQRWTDNVVEFQPDVAVLSIGAWEVFDRKIDGEWLKFGTAEFDEYLLGELDRAIEVLSSEGATVVLLTAPQFERQDTISAGEWTMNERWRTDHLNELFEQAVADNGEQAELVELGEFLCPAADTCSQRLETGEPIRYDGLHFSEEGAEVVARWLIPQLRDIAAS
jgi:peptidoglycan/LPS O-acetylase OafA/YrhL